MLRDTPEYAAEMAMSAQMAPRRPTKRQLRREVMKREGITTARQFKKWLRENRVFWKEFSKL